ncbi:MAG TPA: hypothetical protein VK481_00820 [Gemmatimonadaceae bacterium]|nr:hypothetical protein [Gemmatimonadaceae bacterium]
MQLRPIVTACCIALAMPLTSLPAQTSGFEQPKWSFSLGADPTLKSGDPGIDARMVANLTRSWQSAGSRWGRHVSLLAATDLPFKTDPKNLENCYGCYTRVAKRYFGATADASFDLIRTSRFTPYLKSGVGLYYTKLGTQPSNLSAVINDPIYARSGFSFGVNEGLGFKTRIGSHELFVEQMIHLIDLRRFDKGFAPLNIGVRF